MGISPPITVPLDGRLSCRLYMDSRPHYLETANLQKGLVLLVDGKEVIEEGMGFGLPVVLYQDRPFFSSLANMTFRDEGNKKIFTKFFMINAISRKRFWRLYLSHFLYDFFQSRFHKIYTQNTDLVPLLTRFIELLKILKVHTEFENVLSRGLITVQYCCLPQNIEVQVDFSKLDKKGCREILILNEQGASFFRRYSDTNGLTLVDDQIGPWDPAKAEEVSLSNIDKTISFSVNNKMGANLLRGREMVRRRYSWVGFCYALSPDVERFQYSIKLCANREISINTRKSIPKLRA